MVADSSVYNTILTSLSNVLAKGASLPVELLDSVNAALSTMNAASQAAFGVGEPIQCSITDSLRICVNKNYADEMTKTTLTPGQTDYNNFNNVVVSQVSIVVGNRRRLIASTSSVVSISISTSPSNPHPGATVNATSVVVDANYDGDGELNTIVVLRNTQPVG